MSVVFSPEMEQYLFELSEILFEKGYFVFKETAVKYVTDLIYKIRNTLPHSIKRPAPVYFEQYGKNLYYASFRINRNTQWYAFFSTYDNDGDLVYVVRYISNNHVIAQYL